MIKLSMAIKTDDVTCCIKVRGFERGLQWRIQERGPGVRPPLTLDQTEAQRTENFLLRPGPPYQDKTRQDNALFRVLYSPMYIDFIQII